MITWSLGGALHPLLSRYQPQPAERLPPFVAPLPAGTPALASVLSAQGILTAIDCRLVQWAAGQFWQVRIRALGAPISPVAANHLFMALALDTGWFRHPNTTAESYKLAEELVRLGANPPPLIGYLALTALRHR